MRLVTVLGDPDPQSATRAVTAAAADVVSQVAGLTGDYQVVDLAALAGRLLQETPCPAVEDAVEQVVTADLLLVASPALKGSYSGLLKVFFDRLPQGALAGAVALPLLVMSHPQYAQAVDVHLRPLLVELGCLVPTPGLALLESDLYSLDRVLYPWAAQVARAIGAAHPAMVPPAPVG